MNTVQILQKAIQDRGITFAELARRVGMTRHQLYNSLGKNPSRTLRPEEFINLVYFLELDLSVFWRAQHEDKHQ